MLINKIQSILKVNGSLGIVLGSGLDHIVDLLNDKIIIPYSKIDSFPSSTVDGHKGELISGYFLEKQILIARGRLHLYEGIKKEEAIMPIELFHDLGVKNIIITNSSGSLRLDNKPGSLMLIDGHYDCTFLDSSKLPDLKKGDKYYNFGNKISDDAFEHKGITRYFYDKPILEKILENHFQILSFEEDKHTNPNLTTSVWWKIQVKKN